MPKGKLPKSKGSICNMPIYLADTTNVLPHDAETLCHALLYLRQNSALYSDIEIVLDNIPSDLLSLSAENNNYKALEI